MPMQLSTTIQAGMPTAIMGSYAKLATEFKYEEQAGSSLVVREPIGVCGFITPMELSLASNCRQGCFGCGLHHGRQAQHRGSIECFFTHPSYSQH